MFYFFFGKGVLRSRSNRGRCFFVVANYNEKRMICYGGRLACCAKKKQDESFLFFLGGEEEEEEGGEGSSA